MTEQQIPKLVAALVEHQAAFSGLPTSGAQWVIQNTKPAIGLMIDAVKNRPQDNGQPARELKVLRPVVATRESPQTPFNADTTFFSKNAGVKIYDRGSSFTLWFKGKVEENVPTGNLVPFTLTKSAYDNEIITDLGGEEKAETTLGEIWQLLLKQPTGQSGLLLTNGYANIFYVRDREGKLRAVDVRWVAGSGWFVNALTLGSVRWYDVGQVFSRNS